jgi:uncharacterized phage protein gp47/JayE
LATMDEIVGQMRQTLSITDPDLDTSVGSVTRKILDVVGEAISEAYIDQHLLTYSYDIDSKTDADLDAFVQLFGLARIPAARATGTITFARTGDTSKLISIPVHFQVTTSGNPPVIVQTVAPAVMDIGALSVNVAVQATDGGAAGNIPPGSLLPLSPLDGISTIVNAAALTGGAVQETDDQLRARWKATVFRNMAGTEAMYLGVALNDPDCGAATVIGAAKRRREQLQIVSAAATTTVQNAQSTYSGNQVVGTDIDNGSINLPGVDYTWNTGVNPPRVDVLSTTALPDGTLIDVDFAYLSKASRNSVASAILNRVDVWCSGTRAADASQSVVFRNTVTFSASSGSTYYNVNWVRPDGTNPTVGNIFIPLAFGPIITVPSTMSILGTTYGLATAAHALGSTSGGVTYAYQIVHNDTAFGWSPNSLFGLEWVSTALPANNTTFSVAYEYNNVPTAVQRDMDRWRMIGTDAVVHQAKQIFLKFNIAVIYNLAADPTVTSTAIDTALADYLSKVGLASVVQASDVLQTIHNVPGVDAVRFLYSVDNTGYVSGTPNIYNVGIQQVIGTTVVNSFVDTNGRATDVLFADNALPVFGLTNKVRKAENSFGVA